MKRKKKIFVWILGLCLLVGIWVLGDYVYSKLVDRAVDAWESTIQRDADGVQTSARSYSLPEGDTVLLLIHGFNDTPKTYDLMAPELHEQGFAIRAVRLPGFGVTVDQMTDCTCEQWVETVLAEARQLRQQYKNVLIVGHSLGGAVTIGTLIQDPDLFDGAVLLAPAVDVANHRSPLFPTRFWRGVGDFLLRFSDVYHSPYDRNDCRDPDHRNPTYKSPFSTRNIVQQTFRLMDQNQPASERIALPILMVLSRDDQVTDWVAAERYFERLGSARKQLKFYDESGHSLTVDYDWKNITNDIIDFARSIETGNRYGNVDE